MSAAEPAPDLADADDANLVRCLAEGRQEALGPLYTRYAALVFSLAARSLDRAVAEEIVQDVFLAVWRAAATFDPNRGAVRPWLLQIAHFRIINELRRQSRSPRAAPDPDGLRLVELLDPDPDPAELAWQEEHRAAVRSAVDALPPAQRQAVGLAFFANLTHEEVATALNLPLGTAKTRIRAGLQRLRSALAPLVAALVLALGGLLAAVGVRYHTEQANRERGERALRLVTGSEITVLRLVVAPGAPEEVTHGSYRGQSGTPIAVVTLSHAAPAPEGQTYQAWVRHGSTWIPIGSLRPDTAGSALLIAEGPDVAVLPDAVQVTVEPAGGSPQPYGPVVVAWPER